jgi:hypothetical protein
MPSTYPVGATRVQGETLALSTAAAVLGIPPNVHQLLVYNPATDFRLHLNPAIIDIVFFDESGAAGSEYITASSLTTLFNDLTDRNTGTGSGTTLDAATTSDFLYICLAEPVAGLRVTIGAANGDSSVMTGEYRKNDDTWAGLSITDGTASGGDTLAQTGNITWTAVTDWKRASLTGPQGIVTVPDGPGGTSGHWMRLSFGTALDADTEVTEIWPMSNDSSRGYFRAGQEYTFSISRRVVGAIEMLVAAGTDTAELTWVRTVQGN